MSDSEGPSEDERNPDSPKPVEEELSEDERARIYGDAELMGSDDEEGEDLINDDMDKYK